MGGFAGRQMGRRQDHTGSAQLCWFFGMAAAWGKEKTNDFMRKLNQNRPALRDGNVLIANLLAAGEFPIAITYAYLVERLRMRGAPLTGWQSNRWSPHRFRSRYQPALLIPTPLTSLSILCCPGMAQNFKVHGASADTGRCHTLRKAPRAQSTRSGSSSRE